MATHVRKVHKVPVHTPVVVSVSTDEAEWRLLKVGAGGYLTGGDISADGSVVVARTDTYGGYSFDAGTSFNKQLILTSNVNALAGTIQYEDANSGIVEIRIAQSNTSRFYMMFLGDVWRSDNYGINWSRTGLNYLNIADQGANNNSRTFGPKMAVDPVNADVVYVGSYHSGVYYTTTGGSSWSHVSTSDIPACNVALSGNGNDSDYVGHPGICFGVDPSGGRTQTIIIPVYGAGVYRTTNAGASWSSISSGAPTAIMHAKMAIDGRYYAATTSGSDPANSLYRYDGSWTNISPGSKTSFSVVCDPSNASRVLAIYDGGSINLTANATAGTPTWGGWHDPARLSPDIPWMAWTKEDFMSVGEMQMDTSGNLWFFEGIGLWKSTDYAGGATPSTLTFTSKSQGVENLATNNIVTAPGAKPLLCGWDRSIFIVTDPETCASTHSPDATRSIRMAWDADYATTDNTFIAYAASWDLTSEWAFKSSNSGASWTAIACPSESGATVPLKSGSTYLNIGGCIAVSTPLNWVIVPSGDSLPWYTTDGGSNWTEINALSGMPTSGFTGYGGAYFSRVRCVAADKVNSGTFYLYNSRYTADGQVPSYTGTQSLWRTTNGGVSWTKMNSANIDTHALFYNLKLIAVPLNAGHLFLSGGAQGALGDIGPGNTSLSFSSNAGATWVNLSNVAEPHSVCAGAIRPGNNYPTIYFTGYLSGVWGIYRSTDSAATWGGVVAGGGAGITWTKIGDYPNNWLSDCNDIAASLDTYGLVYVARGGAGYAYYH